MKKRRKIGLLWVLPVLTAVLAACGSAGTAETMSSIKIGVTLYDQYDTYVSELMESFNSYATQKAEETGIAINVEVYNAANSQSTQDEQVEKMIEDDCDVICVNLVDRTEPTVIIDQAEKNQVPIIFFNRELVEEDLERWDQLYYVGSDASESGIMQGQLVVNAYKADPSLDKNGDGVLQYIILEGEAGHQDAIVRTEFSVSTIMDNGINVEKLSYATANWNRAQAQTKMAQMLTQYGDAIELVLANNDDMALGAIDELKAEDIPLEDWPAVVGIDGTDVGVDAVVAGEMIGTVYQDSDGQAREMLNLAFALSTDGDLSGLDLQDGKYIRLPHHIITAETLAEETAETKDSTDSSEQE
ncbi:MAG: galactose ABC transporter substrate-binding protein [Lachnospiraceae bacterium]|nr:galactose ABC transporter substrate-binding protein [Lachnospiraceae bacterium]